MLDFSIYAPFAISYDSCLLGTGLKPFLHGHRWHCLSKGMCRVGCFPRASIHTAGPLNSWEQHCWLGWLWSRAGSWPATGFIHPLPGMDQPQGPQSPDTTNGIELCPRSDWVSGKGCSPEDGQALAQAPQGSGHGPRLSEFKECLHSICTQGLNFGCSCVEPRVGLTDPCRSFPTQYIIWFYDPQACTRFTLLVPRGKTRFSLWSCWEFQVFRNELF